MTGTRYGKSWAVALALALWPVGGLAQAGAAPAASNSARNHAAAIALNNRGFSLKQQGRPTEGEPLIREALGIWREVFGENHEHTATGYSNLGSVLGDMERFAEAAELAEKALTIRRRVLGEDHPDTATAHSNLGFAVKALGRLAEAETQYRTALDLRRARLGDSHAETAGSYNNLASTLQALGRNTEAEALYRKALALRLTLLGETHPQTATTQHNLASVLAAQNKHEEAARLYGAALATRRARLGDGDTATQSTRNGLAVSLVAQGTAAEAEAAYRNAVTASEAALGVSHFQTGTAYGGLAGSLSAQGKDREAETEALKALEIMERAYLLADSGSNAARGSGSDLAGTPRSRTGANYLAMGFNAARPAGADPAARARIKARGFIVAQQLVNDSAGLAMAEAAARAAAGNGARAALLRERQAVIARARAADAALIASFTAATPDAGKRARAETEAALARLDAIDRQIDRDFPEYRALTSPAPVPVEEVQRLLGADEALLMLVEANSAIYSFAVTRTAFFWNRAMGAADIKEKIALLRCEVDISTCSEAATRAYEARPRTPMQAEGFERFDLDIATNLYATLIDSHAATFEGKTKLYVTASGALADLPLAMLVTDFMPPGTDIADPRVLRDAPWLSDRFAITTLPSVSALRQRAGGRSSPAKTGFIGYGDPALKGNSAVARGGGWYGARTTRGSRQADPAKLAAMAPLPGTRAELMAMASLFAAPPDAIRTGAQASEAAVRSDPRLGRAGIVAFATHGLLPQPGEGMDEPGLIFTPPATATDSDDGMLTASEAAELSLSADWVILSACNTASAAGSGGSDSLSALARGFLYAGARALLASHWQVSDEATAALTVETLGLRKSQRAITRGQALQSAMRTVRTGTRADGSKLPGWKPELAHPAYWAPFSHISNRDE